jgi:hypothetical protein
MKKIFEKATLQCSRYQIEEFEGKKRIRVYTAARPYDWSKAENEYNTLYHEFLSMLNDPMLKRCSICERVGGLPRTCKCIGINESRKEAISILDVNVDAFYVRNFDSISDNGYVAFYEAYYNTAGMWEYRAFYSNSKFDAMRLSVDYCFERFGNEINSRKLGDKSSFLSKFDKDDKFSTYVGVNTIDITIFKIVRTSK